MVVVFGAERGVAAWRCEVGSAIGRAGACLVVSVPIHWKLDVLRGRGVLLHLQVGFLGFLFFFFSWGAFTHGRDSVSFGDLVLISIFTFFSKGEGSSLVQDGWG